MHRYFLCEEDLDRTIGQNTDRIWFARQSIIVKIEKYNVVNDVVRKTIPSLCGITSGAYICAKSNHFV
jgi:hypothetical protein